MLSRSHRVDRKGFDEAMKRGRAIHSPLFLVRIAKTAEGAPARMAAVAPVKTAKTSVLRHRVRRKVYEAARPLVARLSPGCDVLVFAKAAAVAARADAIRADLEALFVKAGLLR